MAGNYQTCYTESTGMCNPAIKLRALIFGKSLTTHLRWCTAYLLHSPSGVSRPRISCSKCRTPSKAFSNYYLLSATHPNISSHFYKTESRTFQLMQLK